MDEQDKNIFEDQDISENRRAEDSVFRVLEADHARHFEDRVDAVDALNASDSQSEDTATNRVQSDFASDFADPSLLYKAPEPSDGVEARAQTIGDEAGDTPVSSKRETDLDGYEIIEAEPVENSSTQTDLPAVVGPGLAEKAIGGKPILCLMGEFSAGKSTLSNLLIQTAALPVNVTATQLPPVWISKGNEAPYRVGLDGQEFDIEFERLEEISVEDTAYIRIFHDAELLDHCDLIDMPGISDPNMDAEVWQRVIHHADAVIWCSHATQAWRQSEAAVWSMLPPALYANSFLLLTRMDKILSERDQLRVAKRVGRETVGLFKDMFPISLTRALAADGDAEKWKASGAEDFWAALESLLDEIAAVQAGEAIPEAGREDDGPAKFVMPSRVQPKQLLARRTNSRTRSAPAPLPPL